MLKARVVISAWAEELGQSVPSTERPDLGAVEAFQDMGDEMRLTSKDNAAVARGLILNVRRLRAQKCGLENRGHRAGRSGWKTPRIHSGTPPSSGRGRPASTYLSGRFHTDRCSVRGAAPLEPRHEKV